MQLTPGPKAPLTSIIDVKYVIEYLDGSLWRRPLRHAEFESLAEALEWLEGDPRDPWYTGPTRVIVETLTRTVVHHFPA
jgi:hypothetical protein